jgi:hypothetical protein
MEPKIVAEFDDLTRWNPKFRTGLGIKFISVGDYGIEPIVAPRKLDDHQDSIGHRCMFVVQSQFASERLQPTTGLSGSDR